MTASCSDHAAREPDGDRDQLLGGEVAHEPHSPQAEADAGQQQSRANDPHVVDLQPADPFGLQDARAVGRDDAARVAVVEAQRLAVELERQQRPRIVHEVGRQLRRTERAAGLHRPYGDGRIRAALRRARRGPDRDARPYGAAAPSLDAGDRQPVRTLWEAGEVLAGERDRPAVGHDLEGEGRIARGLGGTGRSRGPVDRQALGARRPSRTPNTETLRRNGTVWPTVSSRARPDATVAPRRTARRLGASDLSTVDRPRPGRQGPRG